MQFVRNGPDIPERLLQAHEAGRVVFFCGAGISSPARLPGFKDLVNLTYQRLSVDPDALQQSAIKSGQLDTAIGLLESKIVGGRELVRSTLAGILTPDLTITNATATHHALLTLGKNREGRTRLITTNYDRLFEVVINDNTLNINRDLAPMLPVPKNRWDSLVYLHGLLSESPTNSELDHLVVSSGDFGLAYLTERWAARFVSELFRSYTVCFVGYSINDAVLRYMMDALAADRLLGESPPEMFAFGSYSIGKEVDSSNEWRAKNVTPILYKEHRRHFYLHTSLREWAKTYRDGIRGKERIVIESAMARPMASTKQDDFVGRMLWALSDPSGLPAKQFADFDPVPSIEWLEPLCEDRFGYADLNRFGASPNATKDDKLIFSITSRPSPYSLAPLMVLVDGGAYRTKWDAVMTHLARWFIRHLDDPTLYLWLVKRGGQLHDQLNFQISHRLEELSKFERDGNLDELNRIRENAPKAIPNTMMRTLWYLLLSGRVKSWVSNLDIYRWRNKFNQKGLTTILRLELRDTLTPRVLIRKPFGLAEDVNKENEPQQLKDLVEWEIVLTADDVHSYLRDLSADERWNEVLPELLLDFSDLLRNALDLMRELGGADDKYDMSYYHQPSISEHPQNRDYNDWTALIDLTRDAWIATAKLDTLQAINIAEHWWQIPYPVFRRLVFFAAAQENVIPNDQSLVWLLSDDQWWLWTNETKREAVRLLVTLAPRLDIEQYIELEQAILSGPPREMFKEDLEPEEWDRIMCHEIWLRLAKLDQVGVVLGANARNRIDEMSAQYPDWQLADDERDEFSSWMSDGGELREFIATPRRRRELVEWIKQRPNRDHWHEDDWRQRSRDNFPTTATALCALAEENIWPTDLWREALQAWSEEKSYRKSWRYMASVLINAPNATLKSLSHGISWWLQAIAKSFEGQDATFFEFCRRLLTLEHQDGREEDDPVMRAINHPVGLITDALLRWWYRSSPEDNQGLPDELKVIFTSICNIQSNLLRHGRLLLAANVIWLFRVDNEWATKYVLPLFDWRRSELEARYAWEGFLWSPRLYRPLMVLIKQPFLETALHYEAIGKHGRQYASLLTFAALEPGDMFTRRELANATRALPSTGLSEVAQSLVRALEGSGEQHNDYWNNRVKPYLHSVWPKSREFISPSISQSLGQLCIASKHCFPDAMSVLHAWLQPSQDQDHLVHKLHESGLCQEYPEPTLDFLDRVIGDNIQWLPADLGNCLEMILKSEPTLANDQRFKRLIEIMRRHGQELK